MIGTGLEHHAAAADGHRLLASADGAAVVTADGRRLLDFASGGVAPFGHELITDRRMLRVPQGFTDPAAARLAERLCEISIADHVRFMASAEAAVELALCAMWKLQEVKKQPKRRRIVTFENGFHGASPLVALATGEDNFARGLEPLGDYFDRAVFNDLASVRGAVGAQTAGILVEPLQRSGTFEPPQNGFLMGLRSIADEYDLVLAYDESVSGLGRTGNLWAHETSGAAPDLMILGDNLAGGLPFGALLMTKRIEKVIGTSESVGHPLAIASAHATLDRLLAPGFLNDIEAQGWAFEDQLYWIRRNHPAIVEAHYGMGLWQTLRLHVPAAKLQQKLWEQGVATLTGCDNHLSLLPPLTVSAEEIKQVVAALDTACASLAPAS